MGGLGAGQGAGGRRHQVGAESNGNLEARADDDASAQIGNSDDHDRSKYAKPRRRERESQTRHTRRMGFPRP